MQARAKRRLAAMLPADIVGDSRRIGVDKDRVAKSLCQAALPE